MKYILQRQMKMSSATLSDLLIIPHNNLVDNIKPKINMFSDDNFDSTLVNMLFNSGILTKEREYEYCEEKGKSSQLEIEEIIPMTNVRINPIAKLYIKAFYNGYNLGHSDAIKYTTTQLEELKIMANEHEKMHEDIAALRVFNAKNETNIEHIIKTLDAIKINTDKISGIAIEIEHIKSDIATIKTKKTWWIQYLIMPIVFLVLSLLGSALIKHFIP
jgi:hypothetical protein